MTATVAALSFVVVAYPFALAAWLIVTNRPRRTGCIPADFDLAAAVARTRRVAYGRAARGRVL